MKGPYRAPGLRGVTPQGRGRFPGFDVLDEVHRWDDVTAGVVLARLAPTVDLSFFTLAENGCATALLYLLLAGLYTDGRAVLAGLAPKIQSSDVPAKFEGLPLGKETSTGEPMPWRHQSPGGSSNLLMMKSRYFGSSSANSSGPPSSRARASSSAARSMLPSSNWHWPRRR